MENRNKKIRRQSLLIAFLWTAVLLSGNLVVSKLVERYPMKWDITSNARYHLTEDSKRVVSELHKPVTVYLIESGRKPMDQEIVEMIDRYKKASNGYLTVESVDVIENPTFGSRFGSGVPLSYGSLVFSCEEQYRVLSSGDLITRNAQGRIQSFQAENGITNALLYVTRDKASKVYVLSGHGESELGWLTVLLKQEYYEVEDLPLANREIPEDADVLLCLSPKMDFTAEEIDKLDAYLQQGGDIQFCFDVGMCDVPRLYQYLTEWGLEVQNNFLLEQDAQYRLGTAAKDAITLLPQVEDYIFTQGITDNTLLVAPFSRSITLMDDNVNRATVLPVLVTSSHALSRTDFSNESFFRTEEDEEGMFAVSAMAYRQQETEETNVLVTGTTQLYLASLMEDNASYSNRDFFLNTVAWMADQVENIQIRPKSLISDVLNVSRMAGILFTAVVFGLSVCVLIAGLVVWIRRRYL